MTNDYLLSLLFLLLIIHWINSASLRSFSKWSLDRRHPPLIVKNEVTTPEPILSRRRPQLISNERRRRWSKAEDNDEVEIPIDDDTNIEQLTSIFTIDNQSTILSDYISSFNSTITEEAHPLLRQDEVEIDPTDELTTISNDNNSTESEILLTNVTEINQKQESTIDNLTTIETINNEIETSTMKEFQPDTAIILLDYTTHPPVITDDNQTLIDSETQSISEYNTTVIDEIINTTTVLNVTQSDTTSIQEGIDVTLSETSTVVNDDDEYSNETESFSPKTTAKPICDRSCQCLKECPYGFEILNDKCKCDPPCKNYQCFGNDTCTVTKKGQPICQPEKGTKHDRPIRCYQPRDAGYHDDDMRYYNRWYYNPDQDECHLFVYRGLGGNENNFQTLHECHLECITCAPSPDPGTCLGYIRMWYYDYQKNQCLQFEYSGCKGNENKFLRKQDCIDTCVTRIINL